MIQGVPPVMVEVGGWKAVRLCDLQAATLVALKEAMTIQLNEFDEASGRNIEVPFELFREQEGLLLIPREGVIGLPGSTAVMVTSTTTRPTFSPALLGEPKASLENEKYPHQAHAVAATVAALKESFRTSRTHGGGILVSPTGSGKTIMGMWVARMLGLKTLITVHKEFLAQQWEDAYKLVFGRDEVPGRIQAGCVDISKPVTIAMVQTLSGERDMSPLLGEFGLMIVDEVHRTGARVWGRVCPMFHATFRLGLTATLDRKDGAMPVFLLHIGPVVHVVEEAATNRDLPQIHVLRSSHETLSRHVESQAWLFLNGRPIASRVLPWLGKRSKRNLFIADVLNHALARGRKVLVLAHTHYHLDKLREQVTNGITTSKFAPNEDLTQARQAQAIFATYAMAKEGLDIPDLDVLIMASPITDPIQAVGRITRIYPGKKAPIVIDIVDEKIGFLKGWYNTRAKKYTQAGYPVFDTKER